MTNIRLSSRVAVCLMLSLSCMNVIAGCKSINTSDVPIISLIPTRYFLDVMIINESDCDIKVSRDTRLYRDVILNFKLNDANVGIKKIADYFDSAVIIELSPYSFIGRRFSYATLSDYLELTANCYDVKAKYYLYSVSGESASVYEMIESDSIQLCLEVDLSSKTLVARKKWDTD